MKKIKNNTTMHSNQLSKSGLYYFGARYYDPKIGRWTAKDPLGMIDGPNMYLYCLNNPINFIDPFGFCRKAFIEGFYDSIADQIWSMTHPFDPQAYEKSALGQTENADAWAYYGTRGAIGVAATAVTGAVAANASGVNPWLGKVVIHGAHAGGPHQYTHIQIMVRTGVNTTKHFRIPLK